MNVWTGTVPTDPSAAFIDKDNVQVLISICSRWAEVSMVTGQVTEKGMNPFFNVEQSIRCPVRSAARSDVTSWIKCTQTTGHWSHGTKDQSGDVRTYVCFYILTAAVCHHKGSNVHSTIKRQQSADGGRCLTTRCGSTACKKNHLSASVRPRPLKVRRPTYLSVPADRRWEGEEVTGLHTF